MSPSYKPQGYSTVSPYLIVDGASRTIDFLVGVFGAVELRRFPDAAGKLRHAEVRIGDTVVMLADGGGDWPAIPASVHVYVADVDGAALVVTVGYYPDEVATTALDEVDAILASLRVGA